MTNIEKAKRRLREAKAALRISPCTCDGKHDPFWARCPRMLAEVDLDNAMEIVRYELANSKDD